MAELAPAQHVGLVNVFSELERELDVMVIDTAAGITDSVLTFCQAAQDAVVVVCDEPASITDAYALIKVLSREYLIEQVWGYDFTGEGRTVDVHIHWLREKIEKDPNHPMRIQTVRGVGYRFERRTRPVEV